MSNFALSLKGVSFDAADLPAVAPLDVSVIEGEHVALLEAGDGAAWTLLRIGAGLLAPTIGRVLQFGADVTDRPPAERASRWLPPGLGLLTALTAVENVALALDAGGRRLDRARAELDRWGAGALADRRPHRLSPAEAARVALVRARAGGARLLLLDRPFLGVPVQERDALRALLETMRRTEGLTLVERFDAPREALAHADRIAAFEGPRLAQCDTPDRIWGSPASVGVGRLGGEIEVFAGRLLDHDDRVARVETEIGILRGLLAGPAAPGEAVTATVRPQRIEIAADRATPAAEATTLAADFVARRLEGPTLRLTFAVGDRRLSLVRPWRGPDHAELAGRTLLTIATRDVRVFPDRPAGGGRD